MKGERYMSLGTYKFEDVLLFSKKHRMIVKDRQNDEVGAIIRTYDGNSSANHNDIRKGSFYAFENNKGELLTSIAVKKKGFKSIEGYEYELYDYKNNQIYHLQDVKWVIYLYFHMKATIQNSKFEAHEDWDEKVVLKLNKKKFAIIKFDEITFNVEIKLLEKVNPFFMQPSFLTQIYCMYRIYSMESKVVEEIIGQIT